MEAEAVSGEMIQIEKPGPPAIVAELAPLVARAKAFEVRDVESHAEALTVIRRFRAGEKGIEDHFARAKKAASDAHKELVRSIAALVGPIADARSILNAKADAYEREERRKAGEEQRRLQAEARKQEEERALMAAIEAEAAGDSQESAAILEQPVSVPVVTVAPAIAKVEGVSTRVLWSAEVTDLHALIVYVAAHPEWVSLLEPSMPNLNRLAVSQRAALSLPGVRAVDRTSRATR